MNRQPVAADTEPTDMPSDPDANGPEAAAGIELPATGEATVDEALAMVSDLSSKTPAESAAALGEVLQRLDRILKDPQDI